MSDQTRAWLLRLVCAAVGSAAASGFARMSLPGYLHGSVQAVRGAEPATLTVGESGRQVLALSIVNAAGTRDLSVRMDGARVTSWLPAVVRLPGLAGIGFEEGRFKAVPPGKKLPVYVVLAADQARARLELVDASDGSVIRSAQIARGKVHGLRHH
ncbi:MAG: hypothetical protein HY924_09810 [Elusimicrobia bacterium]|nr:hypothetical protein [Elusimicrobiota bacterium]